MLDEQGKNNEETRMASEKEIGEIKDEELKKNARKAKEKKEEFESGVEDEIKKRYYVK